MSRCRVVSRAAALDPSAETRVRVVATGVLCEVQLSSMPLLFRCRPSGPSGARRRGNDETDRMNVDWAGRFLNVRCEGTDHFMGFLEPTG